MKSYLKKLFGFFLNLFLLILFINSCKDDSPVEPNKPFIEALSSNSTFITDTITIYGKNFGDKVINNKVIFSNNITVKAVECLKWTISLIRLEVPISASSGTISVVVGNDTSNGVEITIGKFPQFEMVEIPAGSFQMGSNKGLNDEMPVHSVEITKAFFIGKYEVTQKFWKIVMGNNPSNFVGKDLPVESITWLDAIKFCNRLANLDGKDSCYVVNGENVIWNSSANGYRLPTEAEWEYACRAGKTSDFAGTGNPIEMGWYESNSGLMTQPVGRKKANDFGLFDIHGNVREWCWDRYSSDYYTSSPTQDPTGPSSGNERVQRGGSWSDGVSEIRSSNRSFPINKPSANGLRIVRPKN